MTTIKEKKLKALQRWLRDIEKDMKWQEKELAGAKKALEENQILKECILKMIKTVQGDNPSERIDHEPVQEIEKTECSQG